MQKFYVYVFIDHDTGNPIYVGKGYGKRDTQHEFLARNGRKGHLYNWMRKYYKLNNAWPVPFRFAEELNELEAFNLEREMIACYGRIDLNTGCLFNLTDGGEGVKGRIVSTETRKKMSESRKGYKPTPESIIKRLALIKGRKNSLETILKMKIAHQGIKHSPETKAKISEIVRARYPISEETRERMLIEKINRGSRDRTERGGLVVTAETKAKISATLKKIRETIPPANKGKRDSVDIRAKKSEAAIRSFRKNGRIPWNKGVPISAKTILKISESLRRTFKEKKERIALSA